MNEAQVLALIGSLSTSIPPLLAAYKQITANRAGVKTLQQLIDEGNQTFNDMMGIHFTQVPPIGCGLGTSPLSRTR
jgi:hypothetical protein